MHPDPAPIHHRHTNHSLLAHAGDANLTQRTMQSSHARALLFSGETSSATILTHIPSSIASRVLSPYLHSFLLRTPFYAPFHQDPIPHDLIIVI